VESFQWNRYFETGLADVDRQHRSLVDLINQFGALLARNELVDSDCHRLIEELAAYSHYHFEEEEGLMAQVSLDPRSLEPHRMAHQGFLQDVTSMYEEVSSEGHHAAKSLLSFLTHWLAYHILGTDQNMATQIEAIRSGKTPAEAFDAETRKVEGATEPLLAAVDGLFRLVADRNQALKRLNQSLEEKVAERTKALSEANRHLEEISLTDVLTGLPNRRHAMRQLSLLWEDSVANDVPLACLMIDADHFKVVNDTHGHDAGDAVLIELARTLQHHVRNDDIACRLGGDEFLVICPDTDQPGATHIARLVHERVAALRVVTGSGEWRGSISVGVACRSPEMEGYNALVKAADEGVYAAKRDGKNCVRFGNGR